MPPLQQALATSPHRRRCAPCTVCTALLRVQEIYNLKKYSPSLVVLDLRDNPVSLDKAYRSTVLRKLKSLARSAGVGGAGRVRLCGLGGGGKIGGGGSP